MAGPRALTLEQKRLKFPLEFSLKDEYAVYLDHPTPQLERSIYATLKKLAEVVAIHKYGYSPRISYEVLPHEVASSIFMTIVVRRKVVYSWTNLTKKVVRDWVSNRIRADFYETVPTVDISDYLRALDGDDSAGENLLLDRSGSNSGFTAEDMLHFQQVTRKVVRSIHTYFGMITSLRSYLLAVQALHKSLGRPVSPLAAKLRPQDALVFRFHCVQFDRLLLPLRSETAFNGVL